MKQINLKLSEALHALILEAARAKYPQFHKPVSAYIRGTLETQAKKELSK